MTLAEQIAQIEDLTTKSVLLHKIADSINELKELGYGTYTLHFGDASPVRQLEDFKVVVDEPNDYVLPPYDKLVANNVIARTDPIIPAARKVIDVHTDEEIEEFVDEVNKELLARSLGTEFIDFDMAYRYLLKGMTAEEAVEDVEQNL